MRDPSTKRGYLETRVAASTEGINLGLLAVWLQKARWHELDVGFFGFVLLRLSLGVLKRSLGFSGALSSRRGLRILYIAVQGLRVLVGLVSE